MLDGAEGGDCSVEEASSEGFAGLASVVLRTLDEVRFGQWPQPRGGHRP
jgi:hypothetical protein